MGTLAAHDIVVHYMGKKTRIPNVDHQRYSYMQPLNDVAEQALSDMPENVNLLLHMRYGIQKL